MSAAGRGLESTAAGFVLAGGRSSRMGQDKALLVFAGRPLVENALLILRETGLSAVIAGVPANRSTSTGRFAGVGPSLASFAPIVEDLDAGRGPLGGITTALASTSAQHAVFLPVDLPLLPAPLLAFLLHHARMTGRAVTLPAVNGCVQTFPAVLKRSALPVLKAELDAGRSGCFAAFQTAAFSLGEPMSVIAAELLVQACQVSHPDGVPVSRWFLNVNTPPDLRRASMSRKASIA